MTLNPLNPRTLVLGILVGLILSCSGETTIPQDLGTSRGGTALDVAEPESEGAAGVPPGPAGSDGKQQEPVEVPIPETEPNSGKGDDVLANCRRCISTTEQEVTEWWRYDSFLAFADRASGGIAWLRSKEGAEFLMSVLQKPPVTVDNSTRQAILDSGGVILGLAVIPPQVVLHEKDHKPISARGRTVYLRERYQRPLTPEEEAAHWKVSSNVTHRLITWVEERGTTRISVGITWHPDLYTEAESIKMTDELREVRARK